MPAIMVHFKIIFLCFYFSGLFFMVFHTELDDCEVLLPICHNCNKLCDILSFVKNYNTKYSESFFARSEKRKPIQVYTSDDVYWPVT